MGVVVRKNFVFDQNVADHLEELASSMKTSLTKTVQELIEERYAQIEQKKKIEAAESIVGSATGVFGEMSIQDIKANMQ
ncbi:MAG: hypothetical protein J0647_02625 [Campylobacteraceae bacterium]|nr:hypothetical protein [Campylobacteraceae bacterium]